MSTRQLREAPPAAEAPVGPRTLAEELRSRSDRQLARLFAERPDIATPAPSDMTQVGARAATRTSVSWAMDRLDTGQLTVLSAMSDLSAQHATGWQMTIEDIRAAVAAADTYVDACVDHLHAVALVWGSPQSYHVVREALEVVRSSEPPPANSPVDHAPQIATREVDPDRVAQLCAGTASDLVRRVDQLLSAWSDEPPPVLRSGGVGVRDLRAVARHLDIGEDEATFLVELARAARLLDRLDEDGAPVWAPTTAFEPWRQESVAHRWAHLVRAWMQAPGRAVRRLTLSVLARVTPAAFTDADEVVTAVAWHAPRLGEHRDSSARRTLQEAAWLGVTARRVLSPAGSAVTMSQEDGEQILDELLPPPVDHVMLQADLTAVAPGPLANDLARRLEQVAEVESRGGATVYRFTASSVRAALDAGWHAPQVHAFLTEVSRTPVPQPLTYLVDDVARRHGRLRVGHSRGYVRSDDPADLDAITRDHSLADLELQRVAPTVVLSDASSDHLLGRLRMTGYLVVLEDDDGKLCVEHREPRRAPVEQVEVRPATDPAEVVAAVRAGDAAGRTRPAGGGAVSRTGGSTYALAALQDAAELRSSVWLGYMDQAGSRTERVVDPIRVDAGWLTAYDHRSAKVQRFALHRITKVGATRVD